MSNFVEHSGGGQFQLRPYQDECVTAALSGFQEFTKQLGIAPTGAGKTIMFSAAALRTLPKRTLILAHREELIEQAIAKLYSATGIRAEKEKADSYASLTAQVVVASVQSLIGDSRRERWPVDHFGLVVVDEAHHTLADSYRKVLSRWDEHASILGVTATPDRGDRKNLGEYYENIAFEIPLFTTPRNPIPGLIDQGYLSPITLKSVPLKVDLGAAKSIAGDFSEADLGAALEPYLGQIAAAVREYAPFRRVLAFLPLIKTSEKFVEACRATGLRSEHIDGNSPDRAEKLARFSRWEFDLLSNAMLLTEGFDDPGIDCVIVLRPTRSRPLYCQMIGRGTRTHPDKENLLLLDFLWLHKTHRVTHPADLIAKSEEEAEQITKIAEERAAAGGGQEELDLQGMATEATKQREETLARRLTEQSKKQAKFVSADQFALEHDAADVAEYQPTMRWERGPVSPVQARYLKRAKIDPATVTCKGHAKQLLDLHFKSQRLQMASPKQRAFMKRLGAQNADTATVAEAKEFFARKTYGRRG